jgi:hypothetical protein
MRRAGLAGAPRAGNWELESGNWELVYSSTLLSLSAFAMTETELNVMAALAQMGLIRTLKNGYSTPAATGTPTAL